MSNIESKYIKHSQPLFEQFCPIDFSNLHETVICSPVLQAVGLPIKTHILQILNSPSLRYVNSIDTEYALIANQRRLLADFGITINHAILGDHLSSGILQQITNASSEISHSNRPVADQHPCVSKTFEVHGFAAQTPKEIMLPNSIYRHSKEESVWRDGECIPKTSLNSIPEVFMYKGLIFEYIALLTVSLLKNEHRVYRQFAPLLSNSDGTYSQGYRVDGYVDNSAIECKWNLTPDNYFKVERDKRRFNNQDINMIGISYKTIEDCELKFQTYDHLIEPLLISRYPGLSSVIKKLKKVLDSIDETGCLPVNHKVLCEAFYNILDQSSLLESNEKIDFILHHLNQILNIYKNQHQLNEYVEAHEFNLPQVSDESSFRYKSDMYIAYTKPRRKLADPQISFKNFSAYRGVSFPELNLSYIQSMHPQPHVKSKVYYKGDERHSVAFNQGQVNVSQLNNIVTNLNNQQASIAEIYTLFNFIRAGSHRLFLRSSHLHAIF